MWGDIYVDKVHLGLFEHFIIADSMGQVICSINLIY